MAFNQVLRLVMEQAIDVFDEMITPDTAQNVINTIDKIENHSLLKDNSAFVITKHKGDIKIIATKNDYLTYSNKPLVVNIQTIFDELRKKAENQIDNDSE
jgi:hypothetical protein